MINNVAKDDISLKSMFAGVPILGLLCLLVFFHQDVHAQVDTPNLHAVMSDIGGEMAVLFPLVTSNKPYSKSDVARIGSGLDRLGQLFDLAGAHFQHKSTTYQISYQYLLTYLRDAKKAYDEQNLSYTRNRLYGLGYVCTSCHTQDTRGRTLFGGVDRAVFRDDFAYAEYNFITRYYDRAAEYYDKFLSTGKNKTEWQIIQPLQRLITIHLQVHDQPDLAYQHLKQYVDLPQHSAETHQQLLSWLKGIQSLINDKVSDKNNLSMPVLQKYVSAYLGDVDPTRAELFTTPEQEIQRVWLRGRLYHYLNTSPPPQEVPKILYWLAVIDRAVNYNYYFSLADLYLKDCILSYSKHPFAKRCFVEYNEYVHHTYSGSGGRFLPEQVEDELDSLRRALSENIHNKR